MDGSPERERCGMGCLLFDSIEDCSLILISAVPDISARCQQTGLYKLLLIVNAFRA
jgi:hypothetical protein